MMTLNSTMIQRRGRQGLVLAALCATFSAGALACTNSSGTPSASQKAALARMQMSFARLKAMSSARPSAEADPAQPPSIVGMWMTTIADPDGNVIDAGFDVWHSDGTQALNDNPIPASGNVCFGVWKQTDKLTYELKHPTWIYDDTNTNLIGLAYLRETVTLDAGGDTFKGTFSGDGFDLDGNPTFHFDGKVNADRTKG